MRFGCNLFEETMQVLLAVADLVEEAFRGREHLIGRHAATAAAAHAVGHDRHQRALVAFAREDGHPVLLFGAITDMLCDAGRDLESRCRLCVDYPSRKKVVDGLAYQTPE